jgi:hypothetical protein
MRWTSKVVNPRSLVRVKTTSRGLTTWCLPHMKAIAVLLYRSYSHMFMTWMICLSEDNQYIYKGNKTIWMFYGNFADEGYNTVNNPKIYNVEETIGCRPVYNPWQPEVCLKFGSVIVFSTSEIILLSSERHIIQVINMWE